LYVGKETKLPGEACGDGLTVEAADALGLKAGLPVAVSSIDAHVGALGRNNCVCFVHSYYLSDMNSAFSVVKQLIGCLTYLSRIQPSPKLFTSSVPHRVLKKHIAKLLHCSTILGTMLFLNHSV